MIEVIFILWFIGGVLAGLIINVDLQCFKEFPASSTFICLILGPFWWLVLALRCYQLLQGKLTS